MLDYPVGDADDDVDERCKDIFEMGTRTVSLNLQSTVTRQNTNRSLGSSSRGVQGEPEGHTTRAVDSRRKKENTDD
jgi:hypothetical protein